MSSAKDFTKVVRSETMVANNASSAGPIIHLNFTPTVNMQPEQAIQRQILDLLHWRGIFCWKNNTAGIFVKSRSTYIPSHAPGVADILGILPDGRFLAIEVKSPTGRVSPHQQAFLDEINSRGGLAFVARSVEDVEKALNGQLRKTTPRTITGDSELGRAA